MLGIGAVFKFADTYFDMALAYYLYTGTYSGVHISWKKLIKDYNWLFLG